MKAATIVRKYAKKNPKCVAKDLDMIKDYGKVDAECVLQGLLAEEILRPICEAIVDFYCDQWNNR